jgi:hypothetical protein
MKSYYPRFVAGAAPGLVAKLGGLPWGLPARLWPVCRECGQPMSHLAQLPADPPALPLARDEVLFIFKCESLNICNFWEADGGANAVFTVPRQSLGNAPTAAPPYEDGTPTPVLMELGITRWDEADDGAPAELEDAFYDYERHNALPDEIACPHDWDSAWRTKAGGVPYWTGNGAQSIPPGRLLLQIDNWVQLEDGRQEEIANFCSDGTAFVFIDRTHTPPGYSMIINR